jgi:hypothetical protein
MWAELSEKMADRFGIECKYGGGPSDVRDFLSQFAEIITTFEEQLVIAEDETNPYFKQYYELRDRIRLNLTNAIEAIGGKEIQ